jgi:stalled ribosome rescue protein Dom34
MKNQKRIGICMDNSSALLIVLSGDTMQTTTIESAFTRDVKLDSLDKGETTMHNTKQQDQAKYYREIASVIKEYDHVLLFGASNAKLELFNSLKEDKHFDGIKIDLRSTDKMTEKQEYAFVRDYFSNIQ